MSANFESIMIINNTSNTLIQNKFDVWEIRLLKNISIIFCLHLILTSILSKIIHVICFTVNCPINQMDWNKWAICKNVLNYTKIFFLKITGVSTVDLAMNGEMKICLRHYVPRIKQLDENYINSFDEFELNHLHIILHAPINLNLNLILYSNR